MSVVESKLHRGRLTLTAGAGASASTIEVACQATAVSIVPGKEDSGNGDSIEVLCGDVLTGAASSKPADTLNISAIQDWSAVAASSFSAFTWAHRGETVQFSWQPTADAATKWEGTIVIDVPATVGGTVGERLTADLSYPVASLTKVPTGFGTGYGAPAITGLTAPAGGAKEWHVAPAGAALPADLAALKAHAVIGDTGTAKPGAAFGAGEFITLGDGSKANFSGSAWVAGAHA